MRKSIIFIISSCLRFAHSILGIAQGATKVQFFIANVPFDFNPHKWTTDMPSLLIDKTRSRDLIPHPNSSQILINWELFLIDNLYHLSEVINPNIECTGNNNSVCKNCILLIVSHFTDGKQFPSNEQKLKRIHTIISLKRSEKHKTDKDKFSRSSNQIIYDMHAEWYWKWEINQQLGKRSTHNEKKNNFQPNSKEGIHNVGI